MAVHKKHKEPKEEESKQAASAALNATSAKSDLVSEEPKEELKPQESEKESVAVSDAMTEPSAGSVPPTDPLTQFKEKMIEEEKNPISDISQKKNFMWPILFIFIIALAMLGGVFIYKKEMSKAKVPEVNVATISPTPTVMPEPTIALDLSKYEISILNGSEVEGQAGKQKTNLEAEGFTVSTIGNAAKSDYRKAIIQAKENVDPDFLDKLKSVLEQSFVVGEAEELPEDARDDVIVILGSQTN